jgi:hypothetical protein
MAANGKGRDVRLSVARYQVDRLASEPAAEPVEAQQAADDDDTNTAGQATMEHVAQYVEIQIQQSMRRGDFDGLPGAGKPIPNLGGTHDPNWWIRRKIEREQLTGLGPPALTLRTENAELDDRLDRLGSERAVRETLEDFNTRVIEARRQLMGGPPVVTPTRDIDAEVAAWRGRLEARLREANARREQESADRRTPRRRRRARRADADTA